MSQLDPYYVLGVALEANANEIRTAYRRRAAELHPDRHAPEKRAWASEQMVQLNAARDLLLNPVRRAAYDQRMRLEMHKAVWRARRDAYSPPPGPPLRRTRRWRAVWPLAVIAMFFMLGVCLYTVPYGVALAQAPDSPVFEDPLFWLDLFLRLAGAGLRAMAAPAVFVFLLGLVISNLGRLVRR